jgi:hypothetical protein
MSFIKVTLRRFTIIVGNSESMYVDDQGELRTHWSQSVNNKVLIDYPKCNHPIKQSPGNRR